MTDTPRTRDELLEIFADDQAVGAITAQDMRDLIVSVMPSATAPAMDATWQRYSGSGIQTVPTGFTGTPVNVGTPDLEHDPSGLFQLTPYVSPSNGQTYPARSWAILGEGVWMMTTVTTWDSLTNGYRSASSMLIDNYATDYDDYIAVYGTTTLTGPGTAADGNTTMVFGEMITVPSGGAYKVGYTLYQASGSGQQVDFEEWSLKRISP